MVRTGNSKSNMDGLISMCMCDSEALDYIEHRRTTIWGFKQCNAKELQAHRIVYVHREAVCLQRRGSKEASLLAKGHRIQPHVRAATHIFHVFHTRR